MLVMVDGWLVVGLISGAALSTVAGLTVLLLLKVTGVSMEEVRRALRTIREARYVPR